MREVRNDDDFGGGRSVGLKEYSFVIAFVAAFLFAYLLARRAPPPQQQHYQSHVKR